ncbi:MAG TPA: hypothetical protein DEQ40_08455, partial [Oxalobacteraceae bacterium]|nr:hypothetical protein [Oxalobacteraceae bacterium]
MRPCGNHPEYQVLALKERLEPPRGHFLMKVYRRGLLVDEMDKRNLIVVGSQLAHAKLLGGSVTNQSVTTIGYGTSGTTPVFG